jgi:tetratricopeptide (TPR) repeat protein
MKQARLVFLFIFLSPYFAIGNDPLPVSPDKETSKKEIEKLIAHAEDIKGSDPQAALNSAEEALGLAKRINDTLSIVHAYTKVGRVCNYLGYHDKALKNILAAVDLCEKCGLKKELGLAFNEAGGIFYNQGDYERAEKYFSKGLEVRLYLNDKEDIAASLNNVGETYRLKGDTKTALEYYTRALAINTELKRERWLSINCANIGYIYMSEKDYPKALEFFNDQYEHALKGGDKKDLASPMNNLGNYYLKTGDPLKALEFFGKGMTAAGAVFGNQDVVDALKGLSDAYALSGNHEKAYELLSQYIVKKEELQNLAKERQLLELELPFEKNMQEKRIQELESQAKDTEAMLRSRNNVLLTLVGTLALLCIAVLSLLLRLRKRHSRGS